MIVQAPHQNGQISLKLYIQYSSIWSLTEHEYRNSNNYKHDTKLSTRTFPKFTNLISKFTRIDHTYTVYAIGYRFLPRTQQWFIQHGDRQQWNTIYERTASVIHTYKNHSISLKKLMEDKMIWNTNYSLRWDYKEYEPRNTEPKQFYEKSTDIRTNEIREIMPIMEFQ